MMRGWITIARWMLTRLPAKERNALVIHLLDTSRVPIGAMIAVNDDGELAVGGRTLDMEKLSQLRAHARSALENKALILIREQAKYESFVGAATKAATADDLMFYRAALWWGQLEEKYLTLLAGRIEPTDE